jgi:hypothetical protein
MSALTDRVAEIDRAFTADTHPHQTFTDQIAVAVDEFMAKVLRNARTGQDLRERGYTATAAELEHWQPHSQ